MNNYINILEGFNVNDETKLNRAKFVINNLDKVTDSEFNLYLNDLRSNPNVDTQSINDIIKRRTEAIKNTNLKIDPNNLTIKDLIQNTMAIQESVTSQLKIIREELENKILNNFDSITDKEFEQYKKYLLENNQNMNNIIKLETSRRDFKINQDKLNKEIEKINIQQEELEYKLDELDRQRDILNNRINSDRQFIRNFPRNISQETEENKFVTNKLKNIVEENIITSSPDIFNAYINKLLENGKDNIALVKELEEKRKNAINTVKSVIVPLSDVKIISQELTNSQQEIIKADNLEKSISGTKTYLIITGSIIGLIIIGLILYLNLKKKVK